MTSPTMSTLTFLQDDPCNTTLLDEHGSTAYHIETSSSVTQVTNASHEAVASWQWRSARSDAITLGSAPPMPISAWLMKQPFKR